MSKSVPKSSIEPKFPIQKELGRAGDLLGRLQSFLPKIQAANAALPTEDAAVIDVGLQKESDEEDSSDDDSDSGSSSKSDDDAENGKSDEKSDQDDNNNPNEPTIQIQFTMGNMEGNPMMKLLSNDGDDDSGKSDDDSDSDEEDAVSGKKRAIEQLLSESKNEVTTSSKKRPLISEL